MRTKRTEQLALIAEQEESGETVRQFCERKGIPVRTFQQWKVRIRKSVTKQRSSEGDPIRTATPTGYVTHCPSGFIPVQIGGSKPGAVRKQNNQRIIIHVGPTVRLECRWPVDAGYLEETLKVVVRLCGRI
jgi:hypothetical protein